MNLIEQRTESKEPEETLDTTAASNRLRITETRGSTSWVHTYEYTAATNTWTYTSPGNLSEVSTRIVLDGTAGTREYITTVKQPGGTAAFIDAVFHQLPPAVLLQDYGCDGFLDLGRRHPSLEYVFLHEWFHAVGTVEHRTVYDLLDEILNQNFNDKLADIHKIIIRYWRLSEQNLTEYLAHILGLKYPKEKIADYTQGLMYIDASYYQGSEVNRSEWKEVGCR